MTLLPRRSASPPRQINRSLTLSLTLLLGIFLLAACGRQAEPAPRLPTRTPMPTFTPTPFVAAPAPVSPAQPAQPELPLAEGAPADAPAPVAPAQPTPTPEAAKAIVTGQAVNVRTGPGTNYALAGQASRGAELTILARDPAGQWFQVCCVDNREVWIAAFLVDTQGGVDAVAVAQNIPAPPPVSAPAPAPPPAAPAPAPAPAQPAPPPAPSFAFAKFGDVLPRQNSNPVVTFFASLFNQQGNGALGGFRLVVEGPGGRAETAFGEVFLNGDPGMESEFIYNAKLEFMGASPGAYKAYVVDSGGNQVAESFDYTVAGETRTFLPRWKQN